MIKYRVIEEDGLFYPQHKVLWFFWQDLSIRHKETLTGIVVYIPIVCYSLPEARATINQDKVGFKKKSKVVYEDPQSY